MTLRVNALPTTYADGVDTGACSYLFCQDWGVGGHLRWRMNASLTLHIDGVGVLVDACLCLGGRNEVLRCCRLQVCSCNRWPAVRLLTLLL
jgi:hypothetical protein